MFGRRLFPSSSQSHVGRPDSEQTSSSCCWQCCQCWELLCCASRTWCLLEPILPQPRLRFLPKEELSGVVEAPKVLKWGFWGRKSHFQRVQWSWQVALFSFGCCSGCLWLDQSSSLPSAASPSKVGGLCLTWQKLLPQGELLREGNRLSKVPSQLVISFFILPL